MFVRSINEPNRGSNPATTMIPVAPTTPKPAENVPAQQESELAPRVTGPLADVQDTLLKLEIDLRVLGIQAGDVQPPGPNDHPQGRVAEKINHIISLLAQLDVQKNSLTQNIPFEIVKDVDSNQNPNQTAKNRIEHAAVQNQFVHAQFVAVKSFRALLREGLVQTFPDMEPHLEPAS